MLESRTQPKLSCSTTQWGQLEQPHSPFSVQTSSARNTCLVGCSCKWPYTSPLVNLSAFPETIAYSQICLTVSYTCFCNYVIQFNINKPIKNDGEKGVVLWKLSWNTQWRQIVIKKCIDELQRSNCNRLGGNYINLEGICIQIIP